MELDIICGLDQSYEKILARKNRARVERLQAIYAADKIQLDLAAEKIKAAIRGRSGRLPSRKRISHLPLG